MDKPVFKENRFYGRRKGKKLKPSRVVLVDSFLPKVRLRSFEENEVVDAKTVFNLPFDAVWLEVGFGGGEHLAQQSARSLNVGFIGAEVFLNGITSVLAHLSGLVGEGDVCPDSVGLAADRVDNVRIYDEDVRDLFSHFSDNSFDRIYVLFPDPWPKRKHEDRRFIGPKNLPILARLLKPNGQLRIASDDMTYIRWSLEHLMQSDDFMWTAKTSNDWKNPPSDWIKTRYEQKALEKGKKPVYLTFERK